MAKSNANEDDLVVASRLAIPKRLKHNNWYVRFMTWKGLLEGTVVPLGAEDLLGLQKELKASKEVLRDLDEGVFRDVPFEHNHSCLT